MGGSDGRAGRGGRRLLRSGTVAGDRPMTARPRKLIVSASRRQDLPGCEPERLLAGLQARELVWRQPYSDQPQRLCFEPEEIFCLALWSKNFAPLLAPEARAVIDPLRPYFIFTVNDCPELEPGLGPSLEARLGQAALIARHYGPRRLQWRFDPIVHWIDPAGRSHDNLASFDPIARRMAALGVNGCVVSFAQLYGKVRQRERRLGLRFVDPPLEHKRAILARMAECAGELGIELRTCSEPELAGCHPNVRPSRCIDGPMLVKLLDADPSGLELGAHPSRPGCGCTRSTDVGNYEPCAQHCAYCYANPSLDRPAPQG